MWLTNAGLIPKEVGNLTSLKLLRLSSNQLEGMLQNFLTIFLTHLLIFTNADPLLDFRVASFTKSYIKCSTGVKNTSKISIFAFGIH